MLPQAIQELGDPLRVKVWPPTGFRPIHFEIHFDDDG